MNKEEISQYEDELGEMEMYDWLNYRRTLPMTNKEFLIFFPNWSHFKETGKCS